MTSFQTSPSMQLQKFFGDVPFPDAFLLTSSTVLVLRVEKYILNDEVDEPCWQETMQFVDLEVFFHGMTYYVTHTDCYVV